MLYRAGAMTKLKLKTKDGHTGKIEDLYFDDVEWRVRYLVVGTGGWLGAHSVLISPQALTGYREEEEVFTTDLTGSQVEESPPPESDKPVSRQYEERLSRYYGWYPYWAFALYPLSGVYPYPPPQFGHPSSARSDEHARGDADGMDNKRGEEAFDPHLRSFSEVRRYRLKAQDAVAGQVDDLLIAPDSWRVTHLVVDTRPWWPGGEAVIDRGMVNDIIWANEEIDVAMTLDEVKNAPPYARDRGVSDDYLRAIAEYYHALAERRQGGGGIRQRGA